MVRTELDRVAEAVATATTVTVLTGAGISTESGIPDFRGPEGIWTRDPAAERRATIQAWLSDPGLRRDAWAFRAANRHVRFEPNAGHHALVELERHGCLSTLVTQNVDGLHLQAGTSPERLVEIHGTFREVVCLDCGRRWPMEEILARVDAGDEDPHCEHCGGLLKSATVSFGQALDDLTVERARRATERADVFLALGTSLAVYPVAYLPRIAARNGALVAIVNAQPTDEDEVADHVMLGRLGDVLPELVDRVVSRVGSGRPG